MSAPEHAEACRCLICELGLTLNPRPAPVAARCIEHPAFEADYCPSCGTARVIGA